MDENTDIACSDWKLIPETRTVCTGSGWFDGDEKCREVEDTRVRRNDCETKIANYKNLARAENIRL